MARTTSIDLDPAAGPVVRHQAPAGPAAEALRREATVLALARGPGVVDLVDAGDDDAGGAWLTTRYLAGGTLLDAARTSPEPIVVAALARVAATLAELHERGIVHGRCRADHVVGGTDQPALCGFSAASVAVVDGGVDPQADVTAFATLVGALCTSGDGGAEQARAAVAGLVAVPQTTDLRAVSTALLRAAGPGASVAAAPTAATPQRPQGRVLPPRRAAGRQARPGRRHAVRAVGVSVALAAAGLLLLGERGGGTPVPAGDEPVAGVPDGRHHPARVPAATSTARDHVGDDAADGRGAAAGATTEPERGARAGAGAGGGAASLEPRDPAAGEVAAPPPAAPDPGGATSPAAGSAHAAAPVVEHGGARYRVGAPGDLVVVADWDCDGSATPAVVRRDGSVWAFPAWAPPGTVVAARAVGHVESPTSATVADGGDGCDLLAVTTTDGHRVLLPVR